MIKKYLKILEFNIIIDKIKKYCRLDENIENLDDFVLMNDIEEIENSLKEVDEASKLIYRYGNFPLFFNTNVSTIFDKTNKFGVINVEEMLEVSKYFDSIKNIIIYEESLSNNNIEHVYFSKNIVFLVYHKELNLRIKEIVNQYGEILDTASPNLKEIRRKIFETKRNIQSKLNEIISKNASILSEAIVTTRNERYVIPVKNDFKNSIKGITHDASNSGGTVYIEPAIICELNNKLNSLLEDEKQEIFEILRSFSLSLKNIYDELIDNYNILVHLDLVFAKANYGNEIGGTKVKVNDKGIIELYNTHHPLLTVTHIVNNNIFLGKDYQGIIITGPNTGGKTVLLKTLGLLSLMVKFGLLIPASEESNLMIFDEVFADIGDDQDISQNLSTFSSHMKNIIEIMNNVTNNSLVLLDEVGSGTDPLEGSSLAIAIFDTLIEKKCLVCATSHYSELKVHAFNRTDIINASVEFDIKTLKPTYRLLLGIPGQSNALYISKLLGLNEDVINKAKEYTHQNSDDVNIALRKLVHQSEDYDKLNKSLKEKKRELNDLIKQEEEKLSDISIEKNKILLDAEAEAKKIVEKTKTRIDNLINDLESMQSKAIKLHEISDKKHEFRTIKDEMHVKEEFFFKDEEIKVGDFVFINNYGCNGQVIKVLKDDKYQIQAGNAILKVDKNNLKRITSSINDVTTPVPKATNVISSRKTVSMYLDLRGARYEEAKDSLSKYLDDAIYAGLSTVSIIHGFGTGTIRQLVQSELKNNKDVESFRYGGEGEGGQGATIVTFKTK